MVNSSQDSHCSWPNFTIEMFVFVQYFLRNTGCHILKENPYGFMRCDILVSVDIEQAWPTTKRLSVCQKLDTGINELCNTYCLQQQLKT